MTEKLAWGIIGTGAIAKTFARALGESPTGALFAVASRSREKAESFGVEFGAAKCCGSYEELLSEPGVKAVYVATPHPQHALWAIRAAEAGKHVLCEKPMGVNHAEAMAMIQAAREHGVLIMEAFMYRCHPQTAMLADTIRAGTIGEVRLIQAAFGYHGKFNPESRNFQNDLAGGGILDVGCYPVSMSRLLAGAALGRGFADPIAVHGAGHLGSTGIDEWASALLKFPGDILAQVSTSVALDMENGVRVFGSNGRIEVPNPWVCNRMKAESPEFTVRVKGEQAPRVVRAEAKYTSFGLEADRFAGIVAAGKLEAEAPAMTAEDTLGNIMTLDQWRASIGLTYEMEAPHRQTRPLHGRPLSVRTPCAMKYAEIPGVTLPVSRLVLGVDNQAAAPHAHVMFDDFFERGGNCFDTAHIYRGGECEKLLGWWLRNRGTRKQAVLLGKGAHTPHCNPEAMSRQLLESLERLRTDYLDIYMLHRDNPDVPVGEFVDALNEHLKAGRIRSFGASNWTPKRFDHANRYAKRKGLAGFAALSNNFSLARMVAAPWAGCLSASDDETRKWLKKRQIVLMPWSSQAQGFFTGRADLPAERQPDRDLVRCWYSVDNFERRRRAVELAERKGVKPVQIALAYALHQTFPTFPLIGPRTVFETASSFEALKIELTPREVKWLDVPVPQSAS